MPSAKKKTAAKPVGAAMAAGKENLETVVKANAEAASQGVEKAVAMSQEHVAAAIQAGAEAFRGYEDVVSYGKDSVDAVMKSNALFVKGFKDINQALFGLAQASLDDSAAATKKILGCKTVTDVIDVQTEMARAGYARAIEDSRRITDMSVKLAEEAAQPLTKQVSATVEKFSKPIAA